MTRGPCCIYILREAVTDDSYVYKCIIIYSAWSCVILREENFLFFFLEFARRPLDDYGNEGVLNSAAMREF